jgi:hypothetical protein
MQVSGMTSGVPFANYTRNSDDIYYHRFLKLDEWCEFVIEGRNCREWQDLSEKSISFFSNSIEQTHC